MFIKRFDEISIRDIPSVGGKNASLGEMYRNLSKKGIRIPDGFAVTASAYRFFLKKNGLDKKIKARLGGLKVENIGDLHRAGEGIRRDILKSAIPKEIEKAIGEAYQKLCLKKVADVAVRSSATAEDLPDASFAGQQESFLNIRGTAGLLKAYRRCLASLFTDRAIAYRVHQGFDHFKTALSVGVQKMVRSDLASAGVMFTLDTESGFREVVLINSSWGLGESVVKGRVNPDQFFVFKPALRTGHEAVISRRLGSKEVKLIYDRRTATRQTVVPGEARSKFSLSGEEILKLARWAVLIEEYYGRPQDIEWAKDGRDRELYIVQARPETVVARQKKNVLEEYVLKKKSRVICEGLAVGSKIGAGRAHFIKSPKQIKKFKKSEVLVTRLTDPDWEPIMRLASAIVTEQGGKTSHAAIVSRELGVPCVVGAGSAARRIKSGQPITVNCAEGEKGFVYQGILPFEIKKTVLKKIGRRPGGLKTKIMMNLAEPNQAFSLSFLPNDGVGLLREEFIFTNHIKVHPLALINFSTQPASVKRQIEKITAGYGSKKQFLMDKLAEGIAMIAAAFYPKPVIVRFSDFKTNEYASLVGGKKYEPEEENPMLGWRGASRYYDPKFKPAFLLECAAVKKVREKMGLKNVIVMIPFCRTPEEGKKVLRVMAEGGLRRGRAGLEVYVMAEIPTNILQAEEFARIFDGFSIGSNDLTQLTLGVDRDSSLVSHIYDEREPAVKDLICRLIKTAHRRGRKVGICGQAPSDYPGLARFLAMAGIDSISLTPDTILRAWKILGRK